MIKKVQVETILAYLIKLIPLLSIAVVVIGLLSMSILFKKPDYLLRGQYLAFPIILASLIMIYLKPKSLEQKETIRLHLTISKWNYHLIYILLYLITIYLLIDYQTRPIAYFILVGLMAVIILAEILTNYYAYKPANILLKIILLAANIIFGQTLKLPLYFGSTDILPHLHWIETLLANQHVTPELGDYQYFPLYHIFNAIGQLLTNLDLQTAYFIMIGLSFLSSICFIYLITYKATNSPSKSLVAALIYSLSSEALFAGMNMVTRVMSYVIFLVMFYLLISKKPGDIIKNILALFLIIPLVFMHQITLVQEVIILIIFIILELIIYRRNKLIGIAFPIIFLVSFTCYWIYVAGPFFDNIIKSVYSTTEMIIAPETVTITPIINTLIGNLEASIFAFFAIIGVILLLVKGLEQREKRKLGVIFALFSFLAMPLFFPGPASYLARIFLSYRIPLMILPFIIVPTVEGIFFFLNRLNTKPLIVTNLSFVFLTIFIFTLTTTLTLGNSTDLNLTNLSAGKDRNYFKQSELNGFDFCSNKLSKYTVIYTDYYAYRYLFHYAQQNSSAKSKPLEDPSDAIGSCLFLRSDHLKERGKLSFDIGAGKNKDFELDYFKNTRISNSLKKQNKIYENNTGIIYDSNESYI